jgi:hypothetical protein
LLAVFGVGKHDTMPQEGIFMFGRLGPLAAGLAYSLSPPSKVAKVQSQQVTPAELEPSLARLGDSAESRLTPATVVVPALKQTRTSVPIILWMTEDTLPSLGVRTRRDHSIDPEVQQHLLAMKAMASRARRRLARNGSRRRLSFAIAGLNASPATMRRKLGPFITLAPIRDVPGPILLKTATHDDYISILVARWTPLLTHELTFDIQAMDALAAAEGDGHDLTSINVAHDMAEQFFACLRLTSLSEFLVPVVANCSWSGIAGVSDGSVRIHLHEDASHARRIDRNVPVTTSDIVWATRNLLAFRELVGRFPAAYFASRCFDTSFSERDLRMMTAKLWAGIEALVNVSPETTYRLSLSVAALLEGAADARVERFKEVKRLYGQRSDIIHGRQMKDHGIALHVRETRRLLAALLRKMTELKSVPTGYEELILRSSASAK